ncbi:MAG: hypothetical protein HQM12_22040, partial [SAR324 cluster bacterium]|nr:hypothetical protein [SAR324 cluster bacterium]
MRQFFISVLYLLMMFILLLSGCGTLEQSSSECPDGSCGAWYDELPEDEQQAILNGNETGNSNPTADGTESATNPTADGTESATNPTADGTESAT